ncbi:MAG: cell division protein FtsW [Clostridia bacterium]|nr:cell division protein FtsW [Clostridia bacterium]
MPQAQAKTSKGKLALFSEGSIDTPFAIIVLVLLSVGLIMMYSASYTYSYYDRGDSSAMIKNQFMFAVIGVVAMAFVSKVNIRFIKVLTPLAMIGTIGLLMLVLVLPEYKPGFHRWINLGFTTFQPSEIAKFALILFCAWGMEKHHNIIMGRTRLRSEWTKRFADSDIKRLLTGSFGMTLFYGGVVVFIALLVYLENHMSGTILMMGIGAFMLYLGGFNRWYFIAAILAVSIAVIYMLANKQEIISAYENGTIKNPIMKAYMSERIVAWLDKDFDPLGARWQTDNSIYAIGSGGFWGVGLGNSKQKHMYVSEPQNDFIFSIVVEELGFIGATIILVLFALLIWRGVVIGIKAKDRFSSLVAMGIVFQVGLQVVLNVAVVSDFIPNTGISLPFFSYGGTSLDMLLVEMGVVLAISRQSNIEKLTKRKAVKSA